MKKILISALACFMLICVTACGENDKTAPAVSGENVQTDGNSSVMTKSGEKIETELRSFDDGRFFVKVPKSFVQMSKELITKKYPAAEPPDFVFTNEKTTINVAVSLTDTKMRDKDIESYVNAVKKAFAESMDVKDAEVFEKSGRTVGIVECVSKAADTNIYNKMLVFSDKNKLKVVTFNCTAALQEEWQSAADFIIDSLAFPID